VLLHGRGGHKDKYKDKDTDKDKYKVLQRPNVCYIFEEQGVLGGGCQDSLLARKMQAGTGGCKGHPFCLHLLTIPTSQRHISKLFVWELVDFFTCFLGGRHGG